MMVTLSDVAKEANVSKMTVSRVINHPEQVTQELRKLVEQAMTTLDYHPNYIAQALVNNRTNVVKFVTLENIDTTEPYYMTLLFGFARGLAKKQYAFQLVTDPSKIEQGNADGYLITGARSKDYEYFDKLDKPFVLFGENHRGYDFVDNDNQLGEKKATKYALSRLYKHLIFIGNDVKEPFEYSREAGYINTLQQNQMIPQIYRVSNHSHEAQKVIKEHFNSFKKDTCFICASDRIAVGVVRQLLKEGTKLPADFGVIGYDGVFLNQVSNPQLTTVKQPILKMGEFLADMLLQKIEQSGSPQGEIMLEPSLVRRGTTR
jgi:DNA-binding LacI/PurR family transcriptional regulator